jgi:hypothetical protein
LKTLLHLAIACAVAAPSALCAQATESADQATNGSDAAASADVIPSNWSLAKPKAAKRGIPRRGGAAGKPATVATRESPKPRIYGGVNVRSGKRQKGNGTVGVAIPF